mmetsp:Transcript_26556/g.64120  ORF Transcript_26556/g.64120 Transcript_26556/m.64120 type:complete len:807 (+) Transcript_26556:104-2524(+)
MPKKKTTMSATQKALAAAKAKVAPAAPEVAAKAKVKAAPPSAPAAPPPPKEEEVPEELTQVEQADPKGKAKAKDGQAKAKKEGPPLRKEHKEALRSLDNRMRDLDLALGPSAVAEILKEWEEAKKKFPFERKSQLYTKDAVKERMEQLRTQKDADSKRMYQELEEQLAKIVNAEIIAHFHKMLSQRKDKIDELHIAARKAEAKAKEQGTADAAKQKQREQEDALRRKARRWAEFKGIDADSVTPNDVVTKSFPLMGAASDIGFPQLRSFVEANFQVTLDKGASSLQETVLVIAEKSMKLDPVSEFFNGRSKALDLSAPGVWAAVIGPQGSKRREHEKEFRVLVSSQGDKCIVMGEDKNVSNCLSKINEDAKEAAAKQAAKGSSKGGGGKGYSSRPPSHFVEIPIHKGRALKGAGKGQVARQMQESMDCEFQFRFPMGEENCKIGIAGGKAEQAKKQIEDWAGKRIVANVELAEDKRSEMLPKGKGKGKGGAVGSGVVSRFFDFRKNDDVFCDATDSGVVIVAPPELVDEGKRLVAAAGAVPCNLELEPQQARKFDDRAVGDIEAATGAIITKQNFRRGDTGNPYIQITGGDTEAAMQKVAAHIETNCKVTELRDIPDSAIGPLKRRGESGVSVLNGIQQDHGVSIDIVGDETNTIWIAKIVGEQKTTEKAKAALQAKLSELGFDNWASQVINLPSADAQKYINSVVKDMISSTGAFISAWDNKVTIEGSGDALAKAEKAVKDALEAFKNGAEPPKVEKPVTVVATKGPAKKKALNVELDSDNAFPTLGGGPAPAKASGGSGRWGAS